MAKRKKMNEAVDFEFISNLSWELETFSPICKSQLFESCIMGNLKQEFINEQH